MRECPLTVRPGRLEERGHVYREQAVFPDGVCDYGKPANGEQPTIPWLMHDGNGGLPLGDPPKSVGL